MNNFTYLTPAMFCEIDTLARTFAGTPIIVERAEEMNGYFGGVSPMCDYVHVRFGDRVRTPKVLITIANRIDLDAFASTKAYVLDWSAIPAEDAYRFVTWHEIAHVIHVDHGLYFEMTLDGVAQDIKRRIYRLAETRADRYAWDVLYPGMEMPLLPGADDILSEIAETAITCKAILSKVKRKKPVEPLSTDPKDFVPAVHEEDGIPWAPEVGADPFCIWRNTVVDGQIMPAQGHAAETKEAAHA